MLTLVNIEMGHQRDKQWQNKFKKYKAIIKNLAFRQYKDSMRWNYEVSAKVDMRRSLQWQKVDRRNKTIELEYRKSWRFKRFVKQNGLQGVFDEKWD